MMLMTLVISLLQGCRNCSTETEAFIVGITEEPYPTGGTVTVDGETIDLVCSEASEYLACEAEISGTGTVMAVSITIDDEEISLDLEEAYYEKAECKMSGRYVLLYPYE